MPFSATASSCSTGRPVRYRRRRGHALAKSRSRAAGCCARSSCCWHGRSCARADPNWPRSRSTSSRWSGKRWPTRVPTWCASSRTMPRLPYRGDRFWLHMLVAEIIALPGASGAAPTLALESSATDHALRFTWPDFGAAQTDALQRALIESDRAAAGCRRGAAMSDGLSLHWPLQRLDRTQASALDPEQGCEPRRGAVLRADTTRSMAGLQFSRRSNRLPKGACRLASACLL